MAKRPAAPGFSAAIVLTAALAAACGAALVGCAKGTAMNRVSAPPPPSGKILAYGGTALIVMDMQAAYMPIYRQDAVVANINALIEAARTAGKPVIFVQQKGGGAIHPSIKTGPDYLSVLKESPSAFEGTELESTLDRLGAGRLVVCGLASEGCVNATLWGGRALGYGLVLASDAHSTTFMSSEGSIDGQSEEWAARGAEVVPTKKILFN
jgi:isochorismate hydrolase